MELPDRVLQPLDSKQSLRQPGWSACAGLSYMGAIVNADTR